MSISKNVHILVLFLVSIVLLPSVYAFSGSGAGSSEDPYLITNCTQVQEMSDALTSSYQLSNSIDCSDTINWNSGAGFVPIGNSSTKFTGDLNGSSYTISDLVISRTSTEYIGLFGYIDTGSDIRDIGLVDINITGNRYTGGLVGYTKSSVYNSYVSGNVQCSSYTCAGLIGYIYAAVNITNSYSTANVTSVESGVGGLISYAYTSSGSVVIDNCYATGYVQCDGFCGGLLGSGTNIIINNSYATGDVYSTGLPTGGLVGYPGTGTIENSYATGNVNSTSSRVGGLVGSFSGTITFRNCYATGNAITTGSNAGGFSGDCEGTGTIINCYSTGNVTGGSYTGGFIGQLDYSSTVTNSYSTGHVTGSSSPGGFIGTSTLGSCSASYWDTETSGLSSSASCATGGRTTAQMTNVSTYTTTSPWDFQGNPESDTGDNDYWGISENLNDGYPVIIGLGVGEGLVNPVVSLNNPADNYYIDGDATMTFNCSVSGANTMSNISLYITDESNSNFALNQTQALSGSSGSGQWDITLGSGNYTWNCFGQDDQNLTDWSTNRTITLDIDGPTFTTFANQTLPTGNSLSYDMDATDAGSGLDCFTVNDTTNFQITCAGVLTNKTILAIGTYWLNITVNDSIGNEQSSEMSVEITAIPSISLTLDSPAASINATQNATFTVSATISCSDANCGEINVSLDPAEAVINYDDFESNFGHWNVQEHVTCRVGSDPWRRLTSTSSGSTGPQTGGVGGAGTYFIYVETSSGDCYDSGDTAIIYFNETMDYDSSQDENIEFYYHAYGSNIDSLYLEGNSTGSWVSIWEMHDLNQNYWDYESVDLSNLTESGSLRFKYLRTSAGYASDIALDQINVSYTSGSEKSGLVSTTVNDTPFYTTDNNPQTVTLNVGASETVTWSVNSTGELNSTHEFFVYANQTTDRSISDETIHWNVTIVNFTVSDAPVVSISYPTSSDYTTTVTEFNYSVSTPGQILDKCWYSTDAGVTNSSNVSANTNFDGLSGSAGSNTWTIYCNDNNTYIGSSSVTFSRVPLISLEMISSTENNNVTQNETFTVSTRVSCSNVDCTNINVSLDPNLADDSNKYDEIGNEFEIKSAIILYDNKSFDYDIQDGCDLSDGESDVFDGGMRMYVNASEYTGTRSTTEDGGREAICSDQAKSGLNVSRKVYVPLDQNWARYLEILNNPTESEICVDIKIWQNMGSDGSDFMNTSDYDGTWELTDNWMMWDDSSATTVDDAAGFIYQHEDGDEKIDSFIPTTASGGYNQWIWEEVCVPASDTVILMHFFTQWDTRAQSEAEADLIYENIATDLYQIGMSDDEISQVSNLAFAEDTKSGLISTVVGATPFYTISENPNTINITSGESEVITWTVNTTGELDSTHEFFVYANQTTDMSISDETVHWNLTIVNFTVSAIAPSVSITYPVSDANYSINISMLNYSATSEQTLDKCWYSINSGVTNSSNVTAGVNFTDVTSNSDSNTWTVYCNDNNSIVGSDSVTFSKVPVISLEMESPTGDINVTQNETFYVSTLVTCSNTDCGEVNVSLDPTDSTPRTCSEVWGASCVNITTETWSEGQHNVTIWSNDSFGNMGSSDILFTIDSTNPTISILSPSNNTNSTNASLDVTYLASDINLDSCWYSNDSMLLNTTLTDCANITDITWSEGQHNVMIWANDTSGNTGSADISFIIDYTNPTWSVNLTDLTNLTAFGEIVYFNITLNDTNPHQYIFSWYNSTNWENDSAEYYTNGQEINITKTIQSYSDDINWTWYFNDTFGNTNQTDTWGITLYHDSTNPIISILSPANNTNSTDSELDVTYSATDDNLESCWYSNDSKLVNTTLESCANITSVTWSEGSHNITIWANDTSGNVNNSDVSFTYTVPDTTNPEITIDSPANNTNSIDSELDVTYVISESSLDSCWYSNDSFAVNTTLTDCANITSVTWSEGMHTVQVWANDTTGNNNSSSVTFDIDTINPVVTILSPSNNTNSTDSGLDVTYLASDTNLASCWYSNDSFAVNTTLASCVNITTETWSEGNHEVIVWSNDSFGNMDSSDISFTITVADTTNPIISILSPANNTNSTDSELDVTYSATDDNLESCWYSNDSMLLNTTLTDCTNITTETWSEGSHNITIWANDTTGNNNSSSVAFIITVADTTNPEITIDSPANNTNSIDSELDITYLVSDTNLDSCWYSNDSMLVNTTLTDCTNITTETWSEGNHEIIIWANDTTGNNNSSSVTFDIDTINPVVTILYPSNNVQYSDSSLDVTYSAIDDNLETCWYSDGSISVNNILTNCANITDVTWSEGQHNVTVSVYDTVGNLGSANILFVINTTDPIVTILSPVNNTNSSNINLNINYTVDDDIDSCWYSNDSMLVNTTLTDCLNITEINWSETTHDVMLWANDTLGNIGSNIITFTINTSLIVNLNAPINNSGDRDGTLVFNYTVSDNESIANCSLILNNVLNQSNSSIIKNEDMLFSLVGLDGVYNWNINCIDSIGNTESSKTRTFLTVLSTDFDGVDEPTSSESGGGSSNTGDTTDFTQIDISNITNLIIDQTNYGRIDFLDSIDLLSAGSGNGINLNTYINISSNRIELNSTEIPELNISSELSLYNLSFTDPQVLRNDVVCSSEICSGKTYADGNLTFLVTQFSIYSARETPVEVSESEPSVSSSSSSSSVIDVECNKNSDCNATNSCYNHKCVKLFDIEILSLEPSVDLLSFDLEYLVKGMADINNDIIIKFWLQESGHTIILGQDTIYIGSFEEKIKTTKLNLPKDIQNKDYNLYIQVSYDNYKAESFRKLNVNLQKGLVLDLDEFSEQDTPTTNTKTLSFGYLLTLFIFISVLLIGIIYFSHLMILRKRNEQNEQEHQDKVVEAPQSDLNLKYIKYNYMKYYNQLNKLIVAGNQHTDEAKILRDKCVQLKYEYEYLLTRLKKY